MADRLNVLVLMTDQQRLDSLGCYGNTICRTPNLDRLAAQGAVMQNAFVTNPLSMPNRSTMLTGRYPSAHGVRTNGIPLGPCEMTLPQAMAAAGYHTASFGKIHLQPFDILECRYPDGRVTTSYESHQFWGASGPGCDSRLFWCPEEQMPLPYYGFQDVRLAIGHGEGVGAHYRKWLEANHPDVPGRLGRDNALPGGDGGPQCWHSAMPAECHPTKWVADRTIEFLRRRKDAERPFLAFCSIPDPHHPFCPPAPYCHLYEGTDIPLPERREGDLEAKPPHFLEHYLNGLRTSGTAASPPSQICDEHWREVIALTYGMITQIDDNLGRVLDCLDETGLAANTLVLFTTDHGDLMGDHGLLFKGPFNLDGLVRVPMIWRLPGRIPVGRRLDGLCGTVDLMQTLLELAGVEPPPGVQGVSAADYLQDRDGPPRDVLLIENDEDYLDEKLRTLVTPRWKLTVYAGRSYGELYDRENDPGEFVNLWASSDHAGVRRKLEARLLHELILRDDPLPPRFVHA